MLKKGGFVFGFLILFFFLTSLVIAAPKNVKLPFKDILGEKELPGLTCGDGSNDSINKCCVIKDIDTSIKLPDANFFCLPLGGPCASDLPNDAINSYDNKSSTPNQMQNLATLAKKGEGCIVGTPDHPGASNCKCKASALSTLCSRYLTKNPGEMAECNRCVGNGDAIWSGLGCIKITAAGFITSLLNIGLGLAGGIAFLCILYAAILMQTSAGNPERLKKAREYLTNCITGLLLIIFSVLILRIIGVDILGIPFLK